MIIATIAITYALCMSPCPVLESGVASQYAPGVMERVIRVRQAGRTAMTLPAELPDVDGYVAVPECSRIGTVTQIRRIGSDEWLRMLVVDCAGSREALDWMARNRILVEVDFETAKRWNSVGVGIKIVERRDESLDTGAVLW